MIRVQVESFRPDRAAHHDAMPCLLWSSSVSCMLSTEATWVPNPPKEARKTKKEKRKGKEKRASICGLSGLYPAVPFPSCCISGPTHTAQFPIQVPYYQINSQFSKWRPNRQAAGKQSSNLIRFEIGKFFCCFSANMELARHQNYFPSIVSKWFRK